MRDNEAASGGEGLAAPEWPLRPWLLAGLLGLAGLLIHLVTQGRDDVPWQMAAAAFLFFGAIAAALTIEEDRWKAPAVFALSVGAVMAGLAWRAVQYGEYLPDEQYGFAAGVVASGLALPLFQADFLKKRLATSYGDLHYHVWTDTISAAGALAFTGLSWLVLVLLSELFHLLKIDFLRELMDDGWFGWTFSGLAAGAALGTLRNQLKVLSTLQTVLLLVLSLLAVPLAFGLTVFLLATAVSGPQVLWDATRSATPVLLTCAAGAWVLASAIVRYDDAAMSRSHAMRWAALVLAAVILPLAVFAAVSMGLRLGQYGLAPERLWGLVAIVVACVYGLGFWIALLRGRKGGWARRMRDANFHLGLFVCGFAVLLALPLFDFGAISTRNQLARLESGKASAEDFDFAALRWDFGASGSQALKRLAASADPAIREAAQAVLSAKERPHFAVAEQRFAGAFKVYPEGAELPPALRQAIVKKAFGTCRDDMLCRVYLQNDGITAVVLGDSCAKPGMTLDEQSRPNPRCGEADIQAFVLQNEEWREADDRLIPSPTSMTPAEEEASLRHEREAIERGDVTVSPVRLRQIYVGGKPVSGPFK